MPVNDVKCYEFGAFRLMVRTGALTFLGEPVKIKPKAAHVLAVLLKNKGELVSRDDLMDQVWGNAEIEDGNLNNAISELRSIFKRRDCTYIGTEPRKGYRFEGAVTECKENAGLDFDGYISRHGYFEDYTQRFSELIAETRSLTLYFIHSRRWRENHRHDINRFLTKPGSELHVLLPDLEDKALFASLERGFPDGASIRGFVVEAYQDFAEYDAKFRGKVSIRVFNHYPTYSFYLFDELIIAAMYPTVIVKRQVPTFEILRYSEYWSFFAAEIADLMEKKKLSKKALSKLRNVKAPQQEKIKLNERNVDARTTGSNDLPKKSRKKISSK